MTKARDDERIEAINTLREMFPQGSTVYTILRSVSRSGMQRVIGVLALKGKGAEIVDLHPNWLIATALGRRLKASTWDGVVCNGAGMDMGFDLAYQLGQVLYDDGYALKHRWL